MNILFFIGMLVGFGGLVFGYLKEGGVLSALWQLSAFSIVFGGTFGIMFIANPFSNIKRMPAGLKLIILHKRHDYAQVVDMLCGIANKARKDGLLSLEAEADKIGDSFIKKGLGYIADGVDPEFLRKVLENEIETEYGKYESAAMVFEGMGGTAPTMGVLGTVMGMVSILRDMGNVTELGGKIASAFIATMYGIGSANLLWLPIGSQIKVVAQQESAYREVIVEGLMAIQAGEPSSRLRDRLYSKIGEIKDKGKAAQTETES
jgi:chemotaxis protein MotA